MALAIFLAALAITFGEVWRAGPRTFVPSVQIADQGLATMVRSDIEFETWLVARHAYTLVRRPWRLFDTEHCAPGEKTLTLGLPMITLGLLAVPASLLGDPILTYNLSLATLFLASAVAMYLLISDWTGVPAAGIAAGLFYAFHRVKLDQIFHPTEVDTAWIVFALFFARRLFADGRWRDAVGLAVAAALQIAASFYMPLASVFLAIPFAAWLLLSYGLRRVRAAQLLCVALAVVLAVVAMYGPYLAARAETPAHLQAAYRRTLPGAHTFPASNGSSVGPCSRSRPSAVSYHDVWDSAPSPAIHVPGCSQALCCSRSLRRGPSPARCSPTSQAMQRCSTRTRGWLHGFPGSTPFAACTGSRLASTSSPC